MIKINNNKILKIKINITARKIALCEKAMIRENSYLIQTKLTIILFLKTFKRKRVYHIHKTI